MTFLEAAIAILKREGKPLSFKKLTEIALKENLLTVVGRTPEATMQQRLNDAMEKDPSLPLTREKPGVFGLRYYPPKGSAESPTNGESAAAAPDGASASAEGEGEARAEGEAKPEGEGGKRRRRRGGRGRRRRGGAPGEAAATGEGGGDEAEPGEAPASAGEERAIAQEAAVEAAREAVEPGTPVTRGEDERGERTATVPERMSFADAAAQVAAAHGRERAPAESVPAEIAPGAPVEEPEPMVEGDLGEVLAGEEPIAGEPLGDDDDLGDEEAELAEQLDDASGPLIAPAAGTEDMVKGEDHRPVYEEGRGAGGRRRRRGGRGRDRGPEARPGEARGGERPERGGAAQAGSGGERHERGGERHERGGERHQRGGERHERGGERHERGGERPQGEARPVEAAPQGAARPAAGPAPAAGAPAGNPVDAVAEILRSSDGRPMHVRQIVDQALKRRLVRGEPQELFRLVRAAVLVEQRAREQAGRRPRVRSLGGGQIAAGDRKLDGELAQYERELGERAARLSEATRVALHRRIARLQPPAFEALGRLVLERLGVGQLELVKRGDGVAYFGGERTRGGAAQRVLSAIRPGEGELGRRAVGELRAGLKARGFAEGVLIAAGRAGTEALGELAVGAGPVEWYDGEGLASLCAHLGIGVVKRAVAVDTLDVELLAELQEGELIDSPLPAAWLGRVSYRAAWELQEALRARVLDGELAECLLLLEHDPVITLGKSARAGNVLADPATLAARGVERVATSRGGDVTYHGPGQLVAYPVVRLARGVLAHVEAMGRAVCEVAAAQGVAARFAREPTGVWVGDGAGARKLAAFGIHVRRRVAIHGLALNATTPLEAFDLIVPCGLCGAGVTSLAREAGRSPGPEDLARPLAGALARALDRPLKWIEGSSSAVRSALLSQSRSVE